MISIRRKLLLLGSALVAITLGANLHAQNSGKPRERSKSTLSRAAPDTSLKANPHTATVHWQRVPLRDAIDRLRKLFDEPVFVDRRIDPEKRISLDIDSTTAEEVVVAIAADNGWGSTRIGTLLFLGPASAANELRLLVSIRSQEAERLSADVRKILLEKRALEWPRLAQPQSVIAEAATQRGWSFLNAEAIPHDLWSAGELPPLSLAEQLAVLLIGFDLTFEFRPQNRSIEIIPLSDAIRHQAAQAVVSPSGSPQKPLRPIKDTRQVYTLRVRDQPVGAVLKEFSKRLHWSIQIDEEAIRQAGKSLDKRVSFSVENANREQLLDALLLPAGLEYQLDGELLRVVPERY